jgi:hypothetical protein
MQGPPLEGKVYFNRWFPLINMFIQLTFIGVFHTCNRLLPDYLFCSSLRIVKHYDVTIPIFVM